MHNLKLLQPPGFPKGDLAIVAEVRADFDTLSFLGKTPRVNQVFVHVADIVVIRNQEGQLNVDALKLVRDADNVGHPMDIGKLVLAIDRVIQKDFTGEKPVVESRDVKIHDAAYDNIPGTAQLVGVVLGQALQAGAIKGAIIYGTSLVAGIAFLPVGAAILFGGQDSVESDLRMGYRDAYRAVLKVIDELGQITDKNIRDGIVHAKINGSDLKVEIERISLRKCHIKVSARKMLLPQPQAAGGFLYELTQLTK